MSAPEWATDLLARVAADEGRDVLPALTWRRAGKRRGWGDVRPATSSGRYMGHETPKRIIVTAGSRRVDQKLVLLHEIAHWLAPPKEHHGDAFWIIAFRLYRTYGVPLRYARGRETRYRVGAIVGIVADRKRPRPAPTYPDDEWGISSAMRELADAIEAAL